MTSPAVLLKLSQHQLNRLVEALDAADTVTDGLGNYDAQQAAEWVAMTEALSEAVRLKAWEAYNQRAILDIQSAPMLGIDDSYDQ